MCVGVSMTVAMGVSVSVNVCRCKDECRYGCVC